MAIKCKNYKQFGNKHANFLRLKQKKTTMFEEWPIYLLTYVQLCYLQQIDIYIPMPYTYQGNLVLILSVILYL